MDNIPRLNKNVITVTSLHDIEEEKQYWLSKGSLNGLKQLNCREGWFMEKIELHQDFKDFLRLLNSYNVEL